MKTPALVPYTQDTSLTDYVPLPRMILPMHLPSTAVLLYTVLLGRGALSQRNGFTDRQGRVFVIYTVEQLMEVLQISDRAVRMHLKTLEDRGLILRRREVKNGPNHIFLFLPQDSRTGTDGGTKLPVKMQKTAPASGREPPVSNYKKRHNKNMYQHEEGESL